MGPAHEPAPPRSRRRSKPGTGAGNPSRSSSTLGRSTRIRRAWPCRGRWRSVTTGGCPAIASVSRGFGLGPLRPDRRVRRSWRPCVKRVCAFVVMAALWGHAGASAAPPQLRGIGIDETLGGEARLAAALNLVGAQATGLPVFVRLLVRNADLGSSASDYSRLDARLESYRRVAIPVVVTLADLPVDAASIDAWRPHLRALAEHLRGKVLAYQVGDRLDAAAVQSQGLRIPAQARRGPGAVHRQHTAHSAGWPGRHGRGGMATRPLPGGRRSLRRRRGAGRAQSRAVRPRRSRMPSSASTPPPPLPTRLQSSG